MSSGFWWVGGYGPDMGGTAAGIGLLSTLGDGSLEYVATLTETASPGFLATAGGTLFAAAEGAGRVETFAVAADHTLAHLGGTPSGGGSPCHLTVFGGHVIASNYHDGTLGVLDGDQKLRQVIHPLQVPGADAHAHSTMPLDATTLTSLDLGTDSVHLYGISGGALARTATVALPVGTGPRDIARHSSGLLYILGELGGVLLVTRWEGGVLEVVASTPLPGFDAGDHAAAIAFHEDFVYVGLRGTNLISVLRASTDGLTVDPIGSVSCEGDWPRHLVTDGEILHVANERSADVASFRLAADGTPCPIGPPTAVPSPTWLLASP